jgi:hypothetical protein
MYCVHTKHTIKLTRKNMQMHESPCSIEGQCSWSYNFAGNIEGEVGLPVEQLRVSFGGCDPPRNFPEVLTNSK